MQHMRKEEKKHVYITSWTNCCKITQLMGEKNNHLTGPYTLRHISNLHLGADRPIVGSGLGSSGGRITGPRPPNPAAAAHPYAYVENRAALQQHFAGQLLPSIHTGSVRSPWIC